MNQQRSRRFRASKETCEKINEIQRIRSELSLKGASLPPEKPKEEHFDSNCITPVRRRSVSFVEAYFQWTIPLINDLIAGYTVYGKIIEMFALLYTRSLEQ